MDFKFLRGLAGAAFLSLLLNGVRPTIESYPAGISYEFVLSPKFPSVESMMLMYIDCDQRIYSDNGGFYRKTREEILRGVSERKNLEAVLRKYFVQEIKGIALDTSRGIYDPLSGRGRLVNNFRDPRLIEGKFEEVHDAIDIFAPVGTKIHSSVNGVVASASGNWKGHWDKKKGLVYEGGGLSRLSGNGVILFDPEDTAYLFSAHMEDVFVKTGDIVTRGELIGTVGRTGNASAPYSPSHLHYAVKKSGFACGVDGVLVPENPYGELLAARYKLNMKNSRTASR